MGVGDRVWQVDTVGRREGGGKEGVTGGGGRQGVAGGSRTGGISFIRHPCLLFAVIEQI